LLTEKVKAGFPPKILDVSSTSTTLNSMGFKDGEQFIVEGAPNPQPAKTETFKPAASLPKSDKEAIKVGEGYLVARIQRDDNSCLFHSVAYVLERDMLAAQKLRRLVAEKIKADPIQYDEAILGRTPLSYCDWIVKRESWGGGVELRVFSDHYKTEICSIDVGTGRVDRFGEGKYDKRCLVMYSGIHYDALAMTPFEGAQESYDQTIFAVDEPASEEVVKAGVQLALLWKKKRKFTDTSNFALKCDVCKKGLKGEREAQGHANETGHARFSEY
jgi:ubiquitin thioesterase OTU1